MKKTIIIILLVAIFLAFAYLFYTKFDEIKAIYLENRVEELVDEMDEPGSKVEEEEPTATSAVAAAVEMAAAEATALHSNISEVVEITPEPSEAPTEEPTLEPTEEPTTEPTIASSDPGVYLGIADWKDPMDAPKNWPVSSDDYSAAYFENGYYRMTSFASEDGWRLASTESIQDGYVEVTFTPETCSGDDHYGIIFRVPVVQEANRGYLFAVTCDGRYSLREWDATLGEHGTMVYLIRWAASGAINTSAGSQNVLGVMTDGSLISLYINGELVDEIEDDTLAGGHFGALVGWEQTENFTVRLEEAKYWTVVE